MKCPFCSHEETQVIETRDTESLESTRRRRECTKCTKRFTTYEKADLFGIVIVKKDGKREQYDAQKVMNGVMKACEKRPISVEQMRTLVASVEPELRKKDSPEIDSKVIGRIVMRKLRSLDKVAYIRFASVYREFEDLETFKDELSKLLKTRKNS